MTTLYVLYSLDLANNWYFSDSTSGLNDYLLNELLRRILERVGNKSSLKFYVLWNTLNHTVYWSWCMVSYWIPMFSGTHCTRVGTVSYCMYSILHQFLYTVYTRAGAVSYCTYTWAGAVSYCKQELVQYHTIYNSWCSIIRYTRVGAVSYCIQELVQYHTVYKSWCSIIRYTRVGAVSYGIQ